MTLLTDISILVSSLCLLSRAHERLKSCRSAGALGQAVPARGSTAGRASPCPRHGHVSGAGGVKRPVEEPGAC